MHCNSGSRIEGLAYLRSVSEHGLPFVIFDFAGSGISEGDFVTLGILFFIIRIKWKPRYLNCSKLFKKF